MKDDTLPAALRAALHRHVLTAGDGSAPPGAVLALSSSAGHAVAAAGHRQVRDDAGDLAQPRPMSPRTRHDLGSLTKVVATTSAVMTLVDRGELSLDAPLSTLVPGAGASWVGEVTSRQLLLHRAGVWEWWPTYVSARSPDEAVQLVLDLPARYPRGAGRHYSDLGFMLLGAVVAGGRPLAEAVGSLVLAPLGLTDTTYGVPGHPDAAAGAPGDVLEQHMLATGDPYPVQVPAEAFRAWRTLVRVGEVDDGNAFHAFGGAAGHAGLFSTAVDLLSWGDALLASLRDRGPWRRDVVAEFLAKGPDPGQRLGFRSWVTRCRDCTTEAFGHPGFPGVAAAVLPSHGAVVALLTNRLHLADPRSAVGTEPMWRAILDDVHSLLHDQGVTEVRRCG